VVNKMQQDPPVDVPKIEALIFEKHKKFIDEFGPLTEKVAADKRLITDIIFSRLYRILLCFQKVGAIDDVHSCDGYPREITLRKKSFDNYVHILTNGHMIKLEGYSHNHNDFASDVAYPSKIYNNVNEENYDWTKFSEELLDYIHASIYDRKDAAETKITSMFRDNL